MKNLEKMKDAENNLTKKNIIENYVSTLDTFIENDTVLERDAKIKVRQAIRVIESWAEGINNENDVKYNHALTNKLNLLVMAVDGITDKKYIHDFIKRMNVRDATALRRYMLENEPGVDYNIEIERPESLGGGSFKTFLKLDQFLFLNIT